MSLRLPFTSFTNRASIPQLLLRLLLPKEPPDPGKIGEGKTYTRHTKPSSLLAGSLNGCKWLQTEKHRKTIPTAATWPWWLLGSLDVPSISVSQYLIISRGGHLHLMALHIESLTQFLFRQLSVRLPATFFSQEKQNEIWKSIGAWDVEVWQAHFRARLLEDPGHYPMIPIDVGRASLSSSFSSPSLQGAYDPPHGAHTSGSLPPCAQSPRNGKGKHWKKFGQCN